MKDNTDYYIKRTQKDYRLSFKLHMVHEIEQGFLTRTQALDKYGIQARSTIRTWLKKYGYFDYNYSVNQTTSQTPEQRILELEQQVKLLEKKIRAEHLVDRTDKKVVLFDMMIDVEEEEEDFNIPIRKKPSPELLKGIVKKKKNNSFYL